MIKRFDHVTVCVKDLDAAKHFFGLLGFEEDKPKAGVFSGERFAMHRGLDEVEASHTTLVAPDLAPQFEVRLAHCRHPEPQTDPNISGLDKVGLNHVCFAVFDVEATVKHLKSNEVAVSSDLKHFNDRSLYLVAGPEGVTIELVQSDQAPRSEVGERNRSKVLQQ